MDYGFKFSVIMPIYNTEEYLEEAIESIVNQDIGFLENVKLILIDDGSKDNSYEICQRYKDKFPNNIVALSKENGGQGSARNLGLEHVDSEYITFLDSDDKLSLNALSVVYDFFSDHEGEIDIVPAPGDDSGYGDTIRQPELQERYCLSVRPGFPALLKNKDPAPVFAAYTRQNPGRKRPILPQENNVAAGPGSVSGAEKADIPQSATPDHATRR